MFPVLRDYIANKPLINKTLIFPDIQNHFFVKEMHEDFYWVLNSFAMEKNLSSQDEKKK